MLKRRVVSAFEQDVHSSWRQRYCYTRRAEQLADVSWVRARLSTADWERLYAHLEEDE